MSVEPIQDHGQTPKTPTGKLLGIVDKADDLPKIATALNRAGFDKIQSLEGEDGINLLERVSTFFFSDMEERVLHRHIEELRAGNTIIAIETDRDRSEEAARIATENGARRMVHFGQLAVTWLTA